MGFEDVLKRRLGASFQHALQRSEPLELEKFWFRRAVPVELFARPDDDWAELELINATGDRSVWARETGLFLYGLTKWTPFQELEIEKRDLERAIEHDLIFFAEANPKIDLNGAPLANDKTVKIARRRSIWPTPVTENAGRIETFPFMPRDTALRFASFAGVRLGDHERGFEIAAATITGNTDTARAIRTMIPALDGSKTAAELEAQHPWLLRLFDRLGILERAAPKPEWPSPSVTWLGHAAVLFRANGRSILVDPLFFAQSEPEERWLSTPKLDPRTLPKIDAVLITHGDNDHLNPNALLQIAPGVPVIIPRVADPPPPFQVDIAGILKTLGFEQIVQLEPWQSFDLGALRITACPFAGEDWDLGLAKATYLIESPELSAYFAADAARMDETYQNLAEKQVDVAFLGVSGNAESYAMPDDFGYGNFYRSWIPREKHNRWIQHCAGPEDALHSIKIFKPRFAFGYAAGGASWIKTSYGDRGDHQQLKTLLAGQTTQALDLEIGSPVVIQKPSFSL